MGRRPIMDASFVYNPQRDAWKAIRGFLYQVELTVIRWLNLERDTVLYCECGEDIDHVRELLEADPNSQERLLEQVKVRDRITLNSAEALTSLARFHQAVTENPTVHVLFRFATTATPGNEQGAKFPRGLSGITAWNAIREGACSKEEIQGFAEEFRALISRATRPRDLQELVFDQLRGYVASADSKVFAEEFVQRFEWATGLPEPQHLRNEIQSSLLRQVRTYQREEALLLTDVLTVYVLRLLTEKGEKRLTVEDLERVLRERSVSELDRQLLTQLVGFAKKAEAYLSHISSQMESVSQGVAALQGVPIQLNQLIQQFSGGTVQLLPTQLPSPDEPPHLPPVFSKRSELVQILLVDLSKVTWLALVGATGMGKTFVARLIAEERTQGSTAWVSLYGEQAPNESSRRLDLHLLRIASFPDRHDLVPAFFLGALPFSQLVKQAALRLGPQALLVIDELPDLLKVPGLTEKLVQLGMALIDSGSILLTTAQRNLPSLIKERLDAAFIEKQIPAMTLQNVSEMLAAADAPLVFIQSGFPKLAYGVTHGHPSLVAATVSFLRQRGWALSEDQLSKIFTGDPTGEVKTETRRKIFQLLPNDQLRELLYRISLIDSSFGTTILKSVAAVPPSISHPTELLLELNGPWVHQVGKDQFEVSPLLSNTGQTVLEPEVQRNVHKVIGLHYLRGRVGPTRMVQLISHFLAAREWSILMGVFIQLASHLNEKSDAEAFDLFAFSFSSSWPDDMPLQARIAFRTVQVRIITLLGQDARQFNAELEALIQNADAETLPAAFSALLLTGPLNPAAGTSMAVRRALQARRL